MSCWFWKPCPPLTIPQWWWVATILSIKHPFADKALHLPTHHGSQSARNPHTAIPPHPTENPSARLIMRHEHIINQKDWELLKSPLITHHLVYNLPPSSFQDKRPHKHILKCPDWLTLSCTSTWTSRYPSPGKTATPRAADPWGWPCRA